MPEPISPPPTTVTVLIAFSDVELEKFLVIPINLFMVHDFTGRKPASECPELPSTEASQYQSTHKPV